MSLLDLIDKDSLYGHGEFAGVVAVTLGVENFLRLFGQIDVGHDGAIGLSYTDGAMLVRYPFREQDMGRNFSKSPITFFDSNAFACTLHAIVHAVVSVFQ